MEKKKHTAPINIKNKKASFDYEFIDTYTAGIVLTGTEIKSIRLGKCNLKDCYAAVIESNHDMEMLLRGPYPIELKNRISSEYGHLSNADCARLASHLYEHGTRNIMLAHLSEENNTPTLAYAETYSALADDSVNLKVAKPASPVWLIGGED